MRHLFAGSLLGLAVLAADAGAQIIRQPSRSSSRPQWWISGHVGFGRLSGVNDGTTGSTWDFGDAVQYRASLERVLTGGGSIGVTLTHALAPLTFRDFNAGAICPSCDADANITQIFAGFHSGGSAVGFYQALDLGLGATGFYNFQTRDGQKIGPESVDWDFAFMLGYGFGYALTERVRVELVQDFMMNIHQREGLAGGTSTANTMYVTRLGLRYAP